MKKFSFFLALSLAANAAFLVTFFVRPAPAPATNGAAVSAATPASAAAPASGQLTSAQLAALASGDAAQLKAAAVPDDIARSLVIGRAYAKLQARMRDLAPHVETTGRYWVSAKVTRSRENRAEMMKVQREFSDAMRAAGGDSFDFGTSRYDYLVPAKREQLSRIAQDYSEMQSEIYSDMNGIQLPSDREKLRLLRQEQDHDMAAALSPEEYEQYQLHSSQTASSIRNRYGDAIQTEDDYKRIFALQKAFDDQYAMQDMYLGGPPSQELMAARRTAEGKLQEDIQTALGPDNFAALQHAADQEYKSLTSVAKRLNLPDTTADTVYAARNTYAAQSQQINQDTSLSNADRRTQLKALADRANTELQATLGAEGATAYAQRAGWMNMLKSGNAFTTNPKDAPGGRTYLGSTVYPLPPPRSNATTSGGTPPRG